MHIGGVAFEPAGEIDADRDSDGNLVLDYPHLRFPNPLHLRLNYGQGPFLRLRTNSLPQVPGVYAVLGEAENVLYIGRAKDSFSTRWDGYAVISPRNCFVGGQSTNCRINGLIYQEFLAGRKINLWLHPIPDPLALELRLIRELRPPWNLR